jgi:hypothetical protein
MWQLDVKFNTAHPKKKAGRKYAQTSSPSHRQVQILVHTTISILKIQINIQRSKCIFTYIKNIEMKNNQDRSIPTGY